MSKKECPRLTYTERVKIETLLNENRSRIYIAKSIDRNRSTIGREINKWLADGGSYSAEKAQFIADNNYKYKRGKSKIDKCRKLKVQVYRGLLEGMTPELIAGRLKLAYPGMSWMHISYESIYRHIYEKPQGRVNKKLIKLLTRKKTRRRTPAPKVKKKVYIKDGKSIEVRPDAVADRKQAGHWEGDLVIGAGQKSCIGTLVERKTRYTVIMKLKSKKSEHVCAEFAKEMNRFDSFMKRTMTYDNGTEMAEHKSFTEKTEMDVYFAHPYSSWERGTNENTNGLIRRIFPKKTDFNLVTEKQLKDLQDKLNNRPRKVLGYYTPAEMVEFEKLMNYHDGDDDTGLKTGNKSPADLFSFLMPKITAK